MLEIGDYTMYGNNGVCKVMEIGLLDISFIDKEKIFYTLQPVFAKGSTVYTPVNPVKVVMRDILSKEEAWELIDDIPNIPTLWGANDKLLEVKLKDAMRTYESREWIKIIKTLYVRKQERISQGKKVTCTDEKYLDTAENFLFGELSIPLNIPKEDIEDCIIARLNLLNNLELEKGRW